MKSRQEMATGAQIIFEVTHHKKTEAREKLERWEGYFGEAPIKFSERGEQIQWLVEKRGENELVGFLEPRKSIFHLKVKSRVPRELGQKAREDLCRPMEWIMDSPSISNLQLRLELWGCFPNADEAWEIVELFPYGAGASKRSEVRLDLTTHWQESVTEGRGPYTYYESHCRLRAGPSTEPGEAGYHRIWGGVWTDAHRAGKAMPKTALRKALKNLVGELPGG